MKLQEGLDIVVNIPFNLPILHWAYLALTQCAYCMCFLRHCINEDLWDHHLSYERGVTSRFAPIEKFSLNFSISSFVIRVNLLHHSPSLFLYGLSLSLWCFCILLKYYFQVTYYLKVILYVTKMTQNTVTELL